MLFLSNEEKPQEIVTLSWDVGNGKFERKWPASEIMGLSKEKEATSTFPLFSLLLFVLRFWGGGKRMCSWTCQPFLSPTHVLLMQINPD